MKQKDTTLRIRNNGRVHRIISFFVVVQLRHKNPGEVSVVGIPKHHHPHP